ncbi:MAG: hypothetical protein DCC67_03140 [Planctomycetota bacterium]|nr:MAG: hypothetical protein DCC67_03140 [Planctomycetota bacterium]
MPQSITLTPEIREALQQAGGGPLFLVDAASGEQVVVLRADAYAVQFRQFDISETYGAQNAALAGIWSDPALDEYNDELPVNQQ